MPLSKIQLSEATGRRNLIINGAMTVWQRATAATQAVNTYSTADRWRMDESTDGAFTTERSTDNPFGTGYSMKAQVTTADTSLSSNHYARIYQYIEAQNLQHLLYGTSSAKTLTLSFWVKSNKTGTYSIMLRKIDSTPYHFIHNYTISSANTWEKKVITISPTAGSTSFITASAGAIPNDNGRALELAFNLGHGTQYAIGTSNTWSSNTSTYGLNGQVNWMDSTSNNLYLAEVQLEVGGVTDFEHRSYAEELAACRRYYIRLASNSTYDCYADGFLWLSTNSMIFINFPQQMRAEPTLAHSGSFTIRTSSSDAAVSAIVVNRAFNDTMQMYVTHAAKTEGKGCQLGNNNDADAYIEIIAEL